MATHVEHLEMEPDRMGDYVNMSGTAVFKLLFGADGRVVCAKVVSGNPLATAFLLGTVSKWRFKPYRRNGIAQPACGRLRVKFSIVGKKENCRGRKVNGAFAGP